MSSNKAFTIAELIFIIIVIGILVAVIMPRAQNSRLREAADQIVSHIRYTQHLAMMDNKFDPNNNEWFKERWQIRFMHQASIDGDKTQYWSYVVYSDTSSGHSGDPQPYEIARNPMDLSKRLTGGSSSDISTAIKYGDPRATKELNIDKEYGITNVKFSNTCSNSGSTRLAFDYLGRPLKGAIDGLKASYDTTHLMIKQCNIALTNSAEESINITIEPETGFAQVVSP